ncbi:Protein export protein SecD [Nostocoides japonicum T1-X7]|uniref:Protein export protein SecD n=1 Tax=Nostocoides japonicum T1-X7 TaxID=1194083 RepID=A0A077M7D8_9MICO|nr:preprotein translocase subunit YajC [Tetrasphaera japonica]CCH79970.1 Protein export protein SecD [Tetrasphaera japonica T1-X7]
MHAGLGNLLILALPFLLLVFLFWSQRKRQQQAVQLQSSIAVGDQVVTTSGLFGTVTQLSDATADLEIAPGVVVRWDRRAIGSKVAA